MTLIYLVAFACCSLVALERPKEFINYGLVDGNEVKL